MKSLNACLEKMIGDGYTDDFKVTDEGLKSLRTDKIYQPDDISIVNFFRFEGISDPDDMSILYVIETNDGIKGTLIDAFGTYADPEITEFILEVEKINKKEPKKVKNKGCVKKSTKYSEFRSMRKIKSFFSLLKSSFKCFIEDNAFKLSASLSYYTIFSIGPLLIIIISLAGYFLGKEAVQGKIYSQINGLVGNEAAVQIQEIIKNTQQTDQGAIGCDNRINCFNYRCNRSFY